MTSTQKAQRARQLAQQQRRDSLLDLDLIGLVETGSRATGTHTPESDHDLTGIYLETDQQLYGFEEPVTHVYRIHGDGETERFDDKAGIAINRATSSDTEITVHPLRKYLRSAAGGNSSIVTLLFTADDQVHRGSPALDLLREHRSMFLTRKLAFRHAGYARAQRRALLGQGNQRTHRSDLIEAHGYDTKYAGHLVRLVRQGHHLVTTGQYPLPLADEDREHVMRVRRGQESLEDVIDFSLALERKIELLAESCDLPETCDWEELGRLSKQLREVHLNT